NLVRTTMQSAGASEQFIKRVLATPSNQMWYPTFNEMLAARVVTSQSLGSQITPDTADATQPAGPPPKWSEVVADPRYASASPEKKLAIFNHWHNDAYDYAAKQ